MGRLVLFSEAGCSGSKKLISCLERHGLPYVDINLTEHSSRLADLAALCMRRNTPQVFFNTRHVGGCDETIALLKKWERRCSSDDERSTATTVSSSVSVTSKDSRTSKQSSVASSSKRTVYSSVYERFMDEVGQHSDPVDARLRLPDVTLSVRDALIPVVAGHSIQLPGGIDSDVMEMTEMLRDLIRQDVDHQMGGAMYKRSFFGHAVAKVLRGVFGTTTNETWQLAEELLRCRVVVSLQQGGFHESRLYRLQCNATPCILNSYRLVDESHPPHLAENADPSHTKLLHRLLDMLHVIEGSVMDNDGIVDLNAATQLPMFRAFEYVVCDLQRVDLGAMDDSSKIAFGLNTYNIMVKYATIKFGVIPSNNMTARTAFFSALQFMIGGYTYSFNDWEHGILRGNSKPPGNLSPLLHRSDPRSRFAVTKPDPRIQFCLHRGTRLCPPIVRFSATNLETELAIAASNYCEDRANVVLDSETNELHLAHMFRAYRSDFARNEKSLPVVVAGLMKGTEKRETIERAFGNSCNVAAIAYRLPDFKSVGNQRGAAFDPSVLILEEVTGIGKLFAGSQSRKSFAQRSKLRRSVSSNA